ncbi:MAG: transglutaminase family protein [Acidimicrobiia bacterium]
MTWRLSVDHTTTYTYARDVLASYNEARLTPCRDGQLVLDHRVHVTPRVPILRYVDYWGSEVCSFDVSEPHQRLVVTGRSLVETAPPRGFRTDCNLGWRLLHADCRRDEFYEYLTSSAFVTCEDPRVAAAVNVLTGCADPCAAVIAATEWTRHRLAYEPGATDVSTTSSGALDVGCGVCQDFVHVTIALLRSCGVPARYASGYLHPHEDAAIGDTVTGQSHAWLEAWLGEWYPVDPTSGAEVGERHVLVARGRDYGDVAPLKGVFHGPPDLSVDVRVAIQRVA